MPVPGLLQPAGMTGWTGGLTFPNPATTGPAAAGYTSLTPETTAHIPLGGPYPPWVTSNGDGTFSVTGIYFTGGGMTCDENNVTFRGCEWSVAAVNTIQVNCHLSTGITFEYCKFHAPDQTVANSMQYATGRGSAVSTTLSASTIVGATSISTVASIPRGSTIRITSTEGAEYATTGTPSGTGPYTIPIATPAGGLTLAHTSPGSVTGPGLTVDHCDIYWWQQGLDISASNQTITNNFIHDPVLTPEAGGSGETHMESIYTSGGQTGLLISGNYLTNWVSQTAALYMDGLGTYDTVTIENNFLAGGGYAMYLGENSGDTNTITNMLVENNWFSTMFYPNCGNFGYRAKAPTFGSGGNVWSGNKWYDGPNAGTTLS